MVMVVGTRSDVGTYSYVYNHSHYDGNTFSANKIRNNKHVQRNSRIYH